MFNEYPEIISLEITSKDLKEQALIRAQGLGIFSSMGHYLSTTHSNCGLYACRESVLSVEF